MLNYYNRTVEPIVSSITEEMRRKFLTKNSKNTRANNNGDSKMFLNWFRQQKWRNWQDSFTRNEILTSNEIRSVIGIKPSTAPQADELRNKNMPVQAQPIIQESMANSISKGPINE